MLKKLLADYNASAFWAGVTAFVWYAFGAVPLHIAVAAQLGLDVWQSSSWIFIVWFSGAVSSIALTLFYRIPIPITWSIPGLIYLGTLAGQFTFAEIVGANLAAGVLILLLAVLGVGGRLMAWLPLPIIMGMFAGSILNYGTRLVAVTIEDAIIAVPTLAGYLLGRFLNNPRIPPVGLAVVSGAVMIPFAGRATGTSFAWALPTVGIPEVSFAVPAMIAISLPMVILALGLGNVQGLGFLLGQGYKVPVNRISVVVGLNSIVNALFGGHPAIVARTGVAILASPDAGPMPKRYWANLIAAPLTLSIAFAAGLVTALIGFLPATYIIVLAGLAIWSALQDAFVRAFSGTELRFGALVAFIVALTPFSFAGITSAFWAVVVGVIASVIAEREQIFAFWNTARSAAGQVTAARATT